MQLIQNRNFTNKPKTFEDVVKSLMTKTASTVEPVKTAAEDEGKSSGQLDVEPLHQKGESTEPTAKTKAGEGDKEEAKSSGQPEAEAKLVNEPKVEDKKAEATVTTKEAEFSTEKCDECGMCGGLCKCKKDDDPKEEGKEIKESEDEEVDTEAKAKDFVAKIAAGRKYVKVAELIKASMTKEANLDNKTFSWLKEYWGKLYGNDFVAAMLAEK
jgi:ferredoxin